MTMRTRLRACVAVMLASGCGTAGGGGDASGSASDTEAATAGDDAATGGATTPDGDGSDDDTGCAADCPDTGSDDGDDTGTSTCIIPDDRRIDWRWAGVPGGIPHRETICQSIEWSPDVPDYTPVIQAAIDGCPSEQVVQLSAGNFPVSGQINFDGSPHAITLRGAGPDQTLLVPTSGTVFVLGVDASSPLDVTVVSGMQKDSQRITLEGVPAEIVADTFILIDRENDPELVHSTSDPDVRRMSQMVLVTAVEGNDLVIEPPLFFDFSADPHLTYFAPFARFHGIEDLGLQSSGASGGRSFFFDGCYGCWLRNIASHLPPSYHLVAANTLRCEIRNSLFDDSQTYGADNGGVVLWGSNTAWKIEDNIFFRTFPAIELALSSSANVISYNYATDVRGGPDWEMAAGDFNDNHGPHNMMNLYEGNRGIMFQSDGYYGSGSHATLFRNHFGAPHPTYPTGNRQAISLKRWSYYYTVVGNVLGAPDWPANGEYQIDVEYGYDIATIYQLGFPNIGNNSLTPADGASPPGIDTHVEETLLRQGNYDYANADTIWEPDVCEMSLPDSLVYLDAPTWWPAATPWPPIGPDVDGLVHETPAEVRAHALGLP